MNPSNSPGNEADANLRQEVYASNDKLKRQLLDATPPQEPVDRGPICRSILMVMVPLIVLLSWRAWQPAVSVEKPPASLKVTNARVDDGVLVLRISNETGSHVTRAAWHVKVPAELKVADPSVKVDNMAPGATREVRVLLPRKMSGAAIPEIEPMEIVWGP